MGQSVSRRASSFKQPRGGFWGLAKWTQEPIADGLEPLEQGAENVPPTLVGLAVDYLTRFMLQGDARRAFCISLRGATMIDEGRTALALCEGVTGLDAFSISCACKLVGYDTVFRAGAATYKPVAEIEPDAETIAHIREMVQRSVGCLQAHGPIARYAPTFGDAYTETVSHGDADIMTRDTLWDIKTSKKKPTTVNTLQLLIYWRLAAHTGEEDYARIEKLGFLNPRLGTVWTTNVANIPDDVIEAVDRDVIEFGKPFRAMEAAATFAAMVEEKSEPGETAATAKDKDSARGEAAEESAAETDKQSLWARLKLVLRKLFGKRG